MSSMSRLAWCSIDTTLATVLSCASGTFSQTLNAAIILLRISLPRLALMYVNGSSTDCVRDMVSTPACPYTCVYATHGFVLGGPGLESRQLVEHVVVLVHDVVLLGRVHALAALGGVYARGRRRLGPERERRRGGRQGGQGARPGTVVGEAHKGTVQAAASKSRRLRFIKDSRLGTPPRRQHRRRRPTRSGRSLDMIPPHGFCVMSVSDVPTVRNTFRRSHLSAELNSEGGRAQRAAAIGVRCVQQRQARGR
jgi:hypothetical protein